MTYSTRKQKALFCVPTTQHMGHFQVHNGPLQGGQAAYFQAPTFEPGHPPPCGDLNKLHSPIIPEGEGAVCVLSLVQTNKAQCCSSMVGSATRPRAPLYLCYTANLH